MITGEQKTVWSMSCIEHFFRERGKPRSTTKPERRKAVPYKENLNISSLDEYPTWPISAKQHSS